MQHVVVIFSDGFNQRGVECFGFLLQFGGNLFGDILRSHSLVFPHDGLHGEEINYALKLVFLSDWNLNRYRLGVEALAESIDGMLEISTHLVDLVDETNSRDTVFIGLPPNFFRLRLHAMHSVKHSDCSVEHA